MGERLSNTVEIGLHAFSRHAGIAKDERARPGDELSLLTAVLGCLFGFLIAATITLGDLPRPLRTAILTFSGVASNFAGVPLAFTMIVLTGFIRRSYSTSHRHFC